MEQNLDGEILAATSIRNDPSQKEHQSYYPLSSLHYLNSSRNNWPIKVRVTNKCGKKFKNGDEQSEGKFFCMNFIDEWKGEIQAMVFGEECDRFFEVFEVNKCFSVSVVALKQTDKQNNSLNHESTIFFTSSTKVECLDDDHSIPYPEFHFLPIQTILTMEPGNFVDLIGDITFLGKAVMGLSLSARQYTNRRLTLSDGVTGYSIDLTVWNDLVNDLYAHDDSCMRVALRGAKIVTYNEKLCLSTVSTTIMKINEELNEIPGFSKTRDISLSAPESASFISFRARELCLDECKNFEEIKQLHEHFRPSRYTVRAMIAIIFQTRPFYEGCPFNYCRKKVDFLTSGDYYCPKCDTIYKDFQWRFLLDLQLHDFTGSQRVTCFQEGIEDLLGDTTFQLLRILWFSDGFSEFWKILDDHLQFKYFEFRLKFGALSYFEDYPPSITVINVNPVDKLFYCKTMIHDLRFDRYNQMLPVPSPLTQREALAKARHSQPPNK